MSLLVERFAECHRRDPGRRVLHLAPANDSISVDAIWQAHEEWKERFRRANLEAGHVVIARTGNSAATIPMFLAARACGLVWMAVDRNATDPEVSELQSRHGAAATARPLMPSAGGGALLAADLLVRSDLEAARCYPEVAVMKLTSGSSAVPRATLTTEMQVITDTVHIQQAMGIQPGETQIAVIPLSHAYGFSVVLMPLLLQGTAIVLRDTFVPEQWAADVERYGATSFPGVPFIVRHLLTNPPASWPDGIERIVSAGAPLPPDMARAFRARFGSKIHSFYGTTETGGITYDSSDDENDESVGTLLPGVTVTLMPDDGGGTRVHVRSGAVSSGYAASDDDGFCEEGYLTGDYGVFDDRGRLTLTGRVSSFVNVAGRKVWPPEVERVLQAMPGISEAKVLARVDERRGEQVVACIVVEAAARPSIAAIDVRRFCGARLAPHKIPRAFLFLERMPLTARGKVDRTVLEALVQSELDRMA